MTLTQLDILPILYPGINLIADGNSEQPGVGAWVVSDATVTKDIGSPHSGRQCLRIEGDVGFAGEATQPILTDQYTYRMTGWARSVDGVAKPRIYSPGVIEWEGTDSTDWQEIDVTFSPAVSGDLKLSSDSLEGIVEFDDLAMRDELMAADPNDDAVDTVTPKPAEGLIFDVDKK